MIGLVVPRLTPVDSPPEKIVEAVNDLGQYIADNAAPRRAQVASGLPPQGGGENGDIYWGSVNDGNPTMFVKHNGQWFEMASKPVEWPTGGGS